MLRKVIEVVPILKPATTYHFGTMKASSFKSLTISTKKPLKYIQSTPNPVPSPTGSSINLSFYDKNAKYININQFSDRLSL